MTARYRPRRGFNFLLYQDIPMEQVLTDFILRLKKEKKYVTVLRNGLRLMGSLMEKDISVLDELFPWIRSEIIASVPPPPAPPQTGNLEQVISSAVQASVQQAFMNMPSLPATTPVAAPLKQSGTLGKDVQFTAAPSEDDDEDTIVLKELVNKTSPLENLLAGMMKADERSERLYAERLAAGDIDPRSGRSISGRMD